MLSEDLDEQLEFAQLYTFRRRPRNLDVWRRCVVRSRDETSDS